MSLRQPKLVAMRLTFLLRPRLRQRRPCGYDRQEGEAGAHAEEVRRSHKPRRQGTRGQLPAGGACADRQRRAPGRCEAHRGRLVSKAREGRPSTSIQNGSSRLLISQSFLSESVTNKTCSSAVSLADVPPAASVRLIPIGRFLKIQISVGNGTVLAAVISRTSSSVRAARLAIAARRSPTSAL